jgi:hypothetical protein
LAEVEDRLLRFQDHYERAATPFQWTFTRQDLAALLAKLAAKTCLAAAGRMIARYVIVIANQST